ncbi:uncharacterized protein LOC143364682 isoform X2 [Halictus rubicundus]|uniref:uncharacterized protein LOC143359493 isoform X2 n=1 Tax=Halictus rubicundus TaxID=77578 RepID=UPI00403727F7
MVRDVGTRISFLERGICEVHVPQAAVLPHEGHVVVPELLIPCSSGLGAEEHPEFPSVVAPPPLKAAETTVLPRSPRTVEDRVTAPGSSRGGHGSSLRTRSPLQRDRSASIQTVFALRLMFRPVRPFAPGTKVRKRRHREAHPRAPGWQIPDRPMAVLGCGTSTAAPPALRAWGRPRIWSPMSPDPSGTQDQSGNGGLPGLRTEQSPRRYPGSPSTIPAPPFSAAVAFERPTR